MNLQLTVTVMTDEPWLSDQQQRVWRSFLQLTGALNERLDRDLRRDVQMPMAYYLVLAMLSEAPGRSLRMSELAGAVWSSPSRMSHAVDRLEEAGWVERRRATGDRRGQVATLTAAGYRQLLDAAPSHAASVRRIMFDSLTPELLDAFGEICSRALAQLGDRGCTPAGAPAAPPP
jgi:DNA-binding MarR family transcriptional regulator